MSLHSDIVKILNDEGAASEGGWHSWRCFDKDRYPEPCECTEVVASMVISAALDAAREAIAGLPVAISSYYPDDSLRDVGFWRSSALVAIDALRDKP